MLPLKIGVDPTSLRLPLRKALHTAAQLGADAVEIDARGEISPQQLTQTAVRQVRKMLEDLGLRVSAVRFRTRRGYATTDDVEPRVAATKAAMKMAHDLGAGVVVNHVGRLPADRQSDEWRLLVEVLTDLGRHGQHVGGLLAAETGTESGPDLAELLAQLPEGALGVDLNPGNLILHGFSPVEAVEVLGRSILHVHATDAARDRPADPARPTPPGRGEADYPALIAALESCGYRGYYTVCSGGIDRPEREIAEAIAFLRK